MVPLSPASKLQYMSLADDAHTKSLMSSTARASIPSGPRGPLSLRRHVPAKKVRAAGTCEAVTRSRCCAAVHHLRTHA